MESDFVYLTSDSLTPFDSLTYNVFLCTISHGLNCLIIKFGLKQNTSRVSAKLILPSDYCNIW